MFFEEGQKIVCGVRVVFPAFFFTDRPYYGSRALNFIKTSRIDMKYLTGILNSRIVAFWLKNRGKQLGDLLQIDKGPLLRIPIHIGTPDEKKVLISLVERMLLLSTELKTQIKNSNKWHSVKSEIQKNDRQIDQLVYRLYGLSAGEIQKIETVTKTAKCQQSRLRRSISGITLYCLSQYGLALLGWQCIKLS